MCGVGGGVGTYDMENAIGAMMLERQAKKLAEREADSAELTPDYLGQLRKTKQEIEVFALKYDKGHLLESDAYKKIQATYIKGVREHIRRKLATGKTRPIVGITRAENKAMKEAEQKIPKHTQHLSLIHI